MEYNEVTAKQLKYFAEYKRSLTRMPKIVDKCSTFYRVGEQHLIENYEAAKKDNFKNWCIHHRLELTLNGENAHSPDDLKRLGMYYGRPYFELIYMKAGLHATLHFTKDIEERQWIMAFYRALKFVNNS